MAETLVATAVGEFGTSFLAKEAAKVGIKQFIQTYGSTAFQRVSPLIMGGMIAAKVVDAYPPVDLQKEKLFGTSLGSLPGMPTTYYDDTTHKSVTETGEGLVIGGEKKEPLPPLEPFVTPVDPQGPITLSTPKAEKQDTTLITPTPKKEDTTLSTPIPKESGPIVYTKDDISKQTEKLVPEKPEFNYPTKEEQAEYLKEENIFWDKSIKKANEAHPKLQIKNLKKIVEADKHFGAAAMSFESYAESQLIYLTPQKYLDLTKEFGPVKWSQGNELRIKDLERIITEGKELANIPTLYVKKEGENYIVDGQEGRHRSQAFQNLGYDLIPVVIQGTGKDKVADIENKVYTATKRSYLYKEDWTQDYIGFIPKNIISESNYNEDTKEYEDTEVKSVKPEDFYSVRGKKKLFVKEDTTPGIGHNQPPSSIEEQTEKLLEDKELDVSQQTKNLTSKITLEKVKSDVKFKQSKYANTTDVYYKGKKYAEIEKRTDIKKLGGLSDYYLKYPSGTFVDGEEVFTAEDAELGFNNAKDALTQGIYNDLKRKK